MPRDNKAWREKIAAVYEHLVLPIALALRPTLPASIELTDLIQAGLLGLWEATAKYSRQRAVVATEKHRSISDARAASFGFYVRQKIRGYMLDSVRGKQWREATHRSLDSGRWVGPGLNDGGIRDRAVVAEIRDRRPNVEQQMIAQEEAGERKAARDAKLRSLASAVADDDPKFQLFSRKQKKVLEMRYRLGMSQPEAGAELGITQQSLHQIETRALKNLERHGVHLNRLGHDLRVIRRKMAA
jgi:RNA polymerase sigma factor (sigma-70 family)